MSYDWLKNEKSQFNNNSCNKCQFNSNNYRFQFNNNNNNYRFNNL